MCLSYCSADVDPAVVAKGLSPALLTQPQRTFVRIDSNLQLSTPTARKSLLLSCSPALAQRPSQGLPTSGQTGTRKRPVDWGTLRRDRAVFTCPDFSFASP
jgi:hypothetical protein